MDAKRFLRDIRDLDEEVAAKFEQIEELRALATKRTSTPSETGGVQTSNKSDFADVVVKIADMTTALDSSIKELLDKKASAMLIIEQLEDSRYRTVLYQYYFNRKTWEQIAVDMHYTYQWVHVLHGRALIAFEEAFEQLKRVDSN
ncbi:MAG: DUF1492 domain-containing protein [Bacillota bacterium]|nr:DUF1492 domain-containing protein [Bacillota bacterium]